MARWKGSIAMTTTASSAKGGSAPSSELATKGRAAREAARRLATLSSEVKNKALFAIAEALLSHQEEILAANALDMEAARAGGASDYMLDRLLLNHDRLFSMASDVRTVAALPDPVGQMFDGRTLPNGLVVSKMRVPLGVLACIYESRPNVTVDISTLCLKAGNASILRGGKEAIHSNGALARVVAGAATAAGVPEGAVQFIESTDRALVSEMLKMRDIIDLVVPRGGGLIDFVVENATMPVLIGGIGVCHTYVDSEADLAKAADIAYNAKCRRYTICNALDTLLVHRDVAATFLPAIGRRWAEAGIEMRCDERARAALEGAGIAGLKMVPAQKGDFGHEFLAPVAAVRVVDSLEEAIDHIYTHGTGHSDAIVTEDYSAARRFVAEVDTAVVYVNASTQFTDGAQFGLGAEIIDSTQKFHARGPVGLQEITTYKWVVLGSGQTRL
jgi:glutamate-5-semialdehyde dehydrogenase